MTKTCSYPETELAGKEAPSVPPQRMPVVTVRRGPSSHPCVRAESARPWGSQLQCGGSGLGHGEENTLSSVKGMVLRRLAPGAAVRSVFGFPQGLTVGSPSSACWERASLSPEEDAGMPTWPGFRDHRDQTTDSAQPEIYKFFSLVQKH